MKKFSSTYSQDVVNLGQSTDTDQSGRHWGYDQTVGAVPFGPGIGLHLAASVFEYQMPHVFADAQNSSIYEEFAALFEANFQADFILALVVYCGFELEAFFADVGRPFEDATEAHCALFAAPAAGAFALFANYRFLKQEVEPKNNQIGKYFIEKFPL